MIDEQMTDPNIKQIATFAIFQLTNMHMLPTQSQVYQRKTYLLWTEIYI